MTEEEARKIIIRYVDKESKESGWWIFGRQHFEIEFARVLEPYQKDANLPLPERLELNFISMDKRGLYAGDTTYKWNKLFGIAIKSEPKYDANKEETYYLRHLIFCLEDDTVIQFALGNTSHLKNLLGHFISLYRQQFEDEQKIKK